MFFEEQCVIYMPPVWKNPGAYSNWIVRFVRPFVRNSVLFTLKVQYLKNYKTYSFHISHVYSL